jgi:hypothetical protein
MSDWSPWLPFPDPRKGDYLTAPFGPGVYQVRRRGQADMVLFGRGGHCASRMSSLLPKPMGTGTRNNSAKRRYILLHIRDLEYRCRACKSRGDATAVENAVRSECSYLFAT